MKGLYLNYSSLYNKLIIKLRYVALFVLIHVEQTKKPRIKYSLGEYLAGVSGIPVGTCVTECNMFWLNHTPFWRVTGGGVCFVIWGGGVRVARDGWWWEGGNEWYEPEYSTVLHLVVASSTAALTSTSLLKWMKFV